MSHLLPASSEVIVIGGGAAGCVVAARLAASGTRVLLLEAGEGEGDELDGRVPGAALARLAQSTLSWGDVLTPQEGLGGRKVPYAQASGLGGGSSLNLMAWFRGHPDDYEQWSASGAAGWAWSDVEPVFDDIEGVRPGAVASMPTTKASDLHPISSAFVLAGEQRGFPISPDLNGDRREGVGLTSSNIVDGRRWSVVDAYLRPAQANGAPLDIVSGARVRRVVTEGVRAVGVEVEVGGVRSTVAATTGVVLTAGAIRTPQLLMLSGIGDRTRLDALGLSCVLDLPGVGRGLADHPIIYPTWRARDSNDLLTSTATEPGELYRLLRRGPFASLTQTGAMLRSSPGLPGPDVQMFLVRAGLADDLSPLEEPSVSCGIASLTPRSRGEVRLSPEDPGGAPLIDPRFLSERADLQVLRWGLETARELFRAPALAAVTDGPISPEEHLEGDAVEQWIRDHVYSEWHPTGTARMGTDAGAVVDPVTLRVHGADRLWVADASVIPALTRGNTQAPTIMVAERAARRITDQIGV